MCNIRIDRRKYFLCEQEDFAKLIYIRLTFNHDFKNKIIKHYLESNE